MCFHVLALSLLLVFSPLLAVTSSPAPTRKIADGKPARVAVAAIFRDEAQWLPEWIEFHKMQGVRHFFLFDHLSQDHPEEILQQDIADGVVTLTRIDTDYRKGDYGRWIQLQSKAYERAVQMAQGKFDWLAAIDIDEFLFCPTGEPLSSFLTRYHAFPSVVARWMLFGTSGYESIPDTMCMIEALTSCAHKTHHRNQHVKHIVQPSQVLKCTSPHRFVFKKNRYPVDSSYIPVEIPRGLHVVKDVPIENIQINHYWTRTLKWFRESKIGGRLKRKAARNVASQIDMALEYEDYQDFLIQQFVPELKRRLEARRASTAQTGAVHE